MIRTIPREKAPGGEKIDQKKKENIIKRSSEPQSNLSEENGGVDERKLDIL